jgi:hypothetical protein
MSKIAGSKELLPIPTFDIGDYSRQAEACARFEELGLTQPMIAIRFGESLGALLNLKPNAIPTEADLSLNPVHVRAHERVMALVFDYVTKKRYRDVSPFTHDADAVFNPSRGKQYTQTVYCEKDAQNLPNSDMADAPAHCDLYRRGPGKLVLGAHLTTYWGGYVTAARAVDYESENGLGVANDFQVPREMTHGRAFSVGDVHLFVRQAPSFELDPLEAIYPGAHKFTTHAGSGRVYIESSHSVAENVQ